MGATEEEKQSLLLKEGKVPSEKYQPQYGGTEVCQDDPMLVEKPDKEIKVQRTRLGDQPLKKKLLLGCLILAELSEGILLSMIAPFFPQVARKRGIPSIYVGSVFSVFALVAFLSAPIWGRVVEKTGPKYMFICGLLCCGCAAVLFGVLYYTPDNTTFVWMSILTRGVESLAASAYMTSSYTIVLSCFRDQLSTAQGLVSAATSLGFIVGPLIGGALFQAIGYVAALSAAGVFLVLMAVIGAIIIPSDIKAPVVEKHPLTPLLRDQRALLILLSIVTAMGAFGFMDTTIVLSIGKFHLPAFVNSLLFLAPATLHSIFVVVFGSLNDRFPKYSQQVLVTGLYLSAIGLFVFGPAPFLFIPDSLAVRIIGSGIIGFSLATSPVYFSLLHRASLRIGMPDDLATHGFVSGLFVSADHASMLWAPLLGGLLYDKIGFPWDACIIGFIILFVAVLQTIQLVYDIVKERKKL